MEHTTIELGSSWKLSEQNVLFLLTAVAALATAGFYWSGSRTNAAVVSLFDPIPYVFNAAQFVLKNAKFMKRVRHALKRANIIKFYMGPKPVYLVAGTQNIQIVFTRGLWFDEIMLNNTFPTLYKMSSSEVQRFADDKSGRGHTPLPGTEDTPVNKRCWAAYQRVYHDYLSRPQDFKFIIDNFRKQLSRTLEDKYPDGKWTTLSIVDLCRRQVTACAISTLFGPKIFALDPNFVDVFWEFDKHVFALVFGLPAWLNPRPYRAHDQYIKLIQEYIDAGVKNFDWEGTDNEVQWEEHFGARPCREFVKWLSEAGFQQKVAAGALGTMLFAQNSNAIPTATWILMEIFKDAELLQAIREEVSTAYMESPDTGGRVLDSDKLVALPLLQSVWTETLRLHMDFNLVRNVEKPLHLNGVTIGSGSIIQASMRIAHCEESVWGMPNHPAEEFWAYRHIKDAEETDRNANPSRKRMFAMRGRPSNYFPFGGGGPICPGRHFAKYQILTMVGLVVSEYDIEFAGWARMDGSPSDRPAQNDQRYCGAGAMPPDRDMIVRWKRMEHTK